eukprot:3215599-Pleurochrysis_carterae.AAC.3
MTAIVRRRSSLQCVLLLTLTLLVACLHQGGRSVGSGTKRVRQHVNPLTRLHQSKLELPATWPEQYFADPTQPLHIDIGCARGHFVLDLAEKQTSWNVLGLEIRRVLVDAAQQDVEDKGMGNAAFIACNANVNLRYLLEGLMPYSGKIQSATVQFPDPWFKSKHYKRRTLQPELVTTIADFLTPGGWLLLQTDVKPLAEDMRDIVDASERQRLADAVADADDWSVAKPDALSDVPTERETASAALERPVYRRLYTRTDA